MRKRFDLMCAIYMTLIFCLIGVGGLLLYQQEQVIKEQTRYIIGLNEEVLKSAQGAQAYEDYLEAYGHSLWHFNQQAKWLYAENQRMHNELINSELYEIDNVIEGEGWVMQAYSYRKVEPKSVIKYVEIPVEVIKEIEVITYRNISARKWDSVEQFEKWYEELDFRILMPSPVYTVDCNDYSERLQRKALEQGYPVSEALAKNRLYCGVKVTKADGIHAGNLVLIDNTYYWVEPQPDMFNVKRLFDRD